jgi:hypothetical protein
MAATLTSSGVNFSDGTTINGTGSAIGSLTVGRPATNVGNQQYGSTVAGSNIRQYSFYWDACVGGYTFNNSSYNPGLPGTWTSKGGMWTLYSSPQITSLYVRTA